MLRRIAIKCEGVRDRCFFAIRCLIGLYPTYAGPVNWPIKASPTFIGQLRSLSLVVVGRRLDLIVGIAALLLFGRRIARAHRTRIQRGNTRQPRR